MKNEEKAQEICEKNKRFKVECSSMECYLSALEMAEWKDERVKSCFILISKLIRDGLLTKDNPEHIMVEQMMGLYNNLKI